MKIPSRHIISLLLTTLLFLAAMPVQAGERIAVVYRGDLPLHQELVQKLRSHVTLENFDIFRWELTPEGSMKIEINQGDPKPDKIVAFGDLALSFCLQTSFDTSGLFLLVSSQELSEQAQNTGRWLGGHLWVPLAKQFTTIKKILPQSKILGIVTSPAYQTQEKILQKAARQAGFKVYFIETENRRQILPSLATAFKHSDAIVMLPDPAMLNTLILGEMIRLQKQFHTPLIAISSRFVSLGAFMSIEYSLEEIIQQLAEEIKKRKTAVTGPTETLLADCCIMITVNRKVSEQLDISVMENTKRNIIFFTGNQGGRR